MVRDGHHFIFMPLNRFSKKSEKFHFFEIRIIIYTNFQTLVHCGVERGDERRDQASGRSEKVGGVFRTVELKPGKLVSVPDTSRRSDYGGLSYTRNDLRDYVDDKKARKSYTRVHACLSMRDATFLKI